MLSFEDQLQEVTELISLPEVYLKISRLMDDPGSDIKDFAKIIILDANLSAKLLNVVNSAYYGFSGRVSSVSKAISMLGTRQLLMMVLSISAIAAVSSLKIPKEIVEFRTFWRSSLLSGTLSRLLAKRLNIRSNETLFTLGLLHEIGHLFLYSKFPDLALQAIQLSKDKEMRIDQAEQQILDCHYGIIGAKLMGHWQLPENFQYSIRFQPTPQQATKHKIEISILHIAHAYAHKQFIEPDKELQQLIDPYVWDVLKLSPEIVEQTLEAALTASAEMELAILK